MSFDGTGLGGNVLKAVAEAGYEEPTPIQARAIPLVLERRDVLGIAQTGTGKTASFVLPMLDLLSRGRARARMPRSLILEPTRELAAQVAGNFEVYGKYQSLTMALLIGGVSFTEQNRKLDRGVDVLIATPGRLLDHLERGRVLLNGVEFLIVDEADRMLDMGFIPDIERIVKLIPPRRQTLMFSATMPDAIEELAARFLKTPERIEVARSGAAAQTISHQIFWTSERRKFGDLRSFLRKRQGENALIFCNRKRDVGVVRRALSAAGFSAGALHGDMDQFSRSAMLEQFRSGEVALLVASNVAARGLDIAQIGHVINFDVPMHAEDYVHRVGRTGRAGEQGEAFTLATADELHHVEAIESLMGKMIPESPSSPPRPEAEDEATRGHATRGHATGGKAAGGRATGGRATSGRAGERDRPQGRGERGRASARGRSRGGQSDREGGGRSVRNGSPPRRNEREAREPRESRGDRARPNRESGGADHLPAFLRKPSPRAGQARPADED